MIIVDTNIVGYLYLPGEFSHLAAYLLDQQPLWGAPAMWRSEFRNVLALYLRKNMLNFENALAIQNQAEALLSEREYSVDSYTVLKLAHQSGCTAYDCEFVALAKRLNTKLITMDKKVLSAFPDIAVSLTSVAH